MVYLISYELVILDVVDPVVDVVVISCDKLCGYDPNVVITLGGASMLIRVEDSYGTP